MGGYDPYALLGDATEGLLGPLPGSSAAAAGTRDSTREGTHEDAFHEAMEMADAAVAEASEHAYAAALSSSEVAAAAAAARSRKRLHALNTFGLDIGLDDVDYDAATAERAAAAAEAGLDDEQLAAAARRVCHYFGLPY